MAPKMTPAEHRQRALDLVEATRELSPLAPRTALLLAEANVHATLSLSQELADTKPAEAAEAPAATTTKKRAPRRTSKATEAAPSTDEEASK